MLLTTALAAGCFKDDPAAPPSETNESAAGPEMNVTAERSVEAAAFQETNKTEEGLGGRAHTHDYWQGKTRIDVISQRTTIFPFPVLGATNEVGSQSVDLQPPQPSLIYEGTQTVEVLVREAMLARPGDTDVPHPAPPTLELWYLTAADAAAAWRDAGPVTYDTPVILPVTGKDVDMPHSLASLWLFRLVTPGSHDFSVNITVTAVFGENAPVWPGHPDFYADSPSRLVLDADGTTTEEGLGASVVKDYGYDYVNPEKLISWGTKKVIVFVNVTNIAYGGAVPADPLYFYLRVRNATSQSDNTSFNDQEIGTGAQREYMWELDVDPNGMDSPYAPSSRWGFAMGAFYSAFSDSSPYTVSYHITVYAIGESGDRPPDGAVETTGEKKAGAAERTSAPASLISAGLRAG